MQEKNIKKLKKFNKIISDAIISFSLDNKDIPDNELASICLTGLINTCATAILSSSNNESKIYLIMNGFLRGITDIVTRVNTHEKQNSMH